MLYNKLEDVITDLINVAQGREKPDLMIKNARLINVHTLELLDNICILIKHGRIVYVGELIDANAKEIIDLEHRFITPGFMDAHCHIESSLLTPINYAKAVVRFGTTAVFADPHEIANVLGIEGFKLFAKEAEVAPIRICLEIPSCVPAVSDEFSTNKASIDAEDVKELFEYSNILGEVMDYNAVLACKADIINKIRYALESNVVIDGHAPMLSTRDLCSYSSAGITSCHENDDERDLINKLRVGMYAMIREGSLSRNIKLLKTVKHTRRISFASDDLLPTDIIKRGHINYNIIRAIEEGIDTLTAIQMATLNVAERFGLSLHLGSIAPARLADMVVLEDLKRFKCKMVFVNGKLVVADDKYILKERSFTYPNNVKNSVRVRSKIRAEDLIIKTNGRVNANIIGVKDSLITEHLIEELNSRDGKLSTNGLEKVVVVERHYASGNITVGLVKGFGLEYGAIASSVSHDSHNLIAVGINDEDIALALNIVIDMQGGLAVVKGDVLAKLELPIGGIVSDKDADIVAKLLSNVLQIIKKELRCKHNSPLTALTFLTLPVIPELRITDQGLINVKSNKIVSLLQKK